MRERLIQLATLAKLRSVLPEPLYLGGSFSRGEQDAYSDLDLTFRADEDWSPHRLVGILAAVQRVELGGQILYHGVLNDGTLIDLIPGPPPEGAKRAELFAPERITFRPEGAIERGPLAEYWIHTHKHRKPIARGLPMMAQLGLAHDRTFLIRLWSIHGGLPDPGPNLGGIHAMSRLLPELTSESRMRLLGMPTGTPAELMAAIDAIQQEVLSLELPGADRISGIVRQSFSAFITPNL